MYGNWVAHETVNASTDQASESGLQLQYWGSCAFVLEANKTTMNGLSDWFSCLKTWLRLTIRSGVLDSREMFRMDQNSSGQAPLPDLHFQVRQLFGVCAPHDVDKCNCCDVVQP